MTKPQYEFIPISRSQPIIFKIDRDLWEVFHYHPEFDILLSLKDHRGRFISGDHIGALEHGTLIMNGPNLPHALHSGRPDERDWKRPSLAVLQFSEYFLGNEFLDRQELKPIRNFLQAAKYGFQFHGETQRKAAELIVEMRDQNEPERFIQLLRLLLLFAESDERHQLTSTVSVSSVKVADINRLDCVVHYLRESMSNSIRLDEVAKVAGLAPKSFCRFFRASTGKTFVEYLNALRIGETCRSLQETDDSVTDIAFRVGFNNLSNFNRQFRKLKGMSPREFRAKCVDLCQNSFKMS